MALNFPTNPTDGQTYEGYVYDATAGVWNSDPHQIASRFVTSATAPSSPSEGDGWFDTNTAKSYVYYDGVWVQLGALGTVDLNQIADVNVSSPANGESLVYDGTEWVNQNVTVEPTEIYDVSTTSVGKFALPAGTTSERPETPNAGDIRFNTETGEPEWYSEDGDAWYSFRQAPSFDVEYLVVAGGGGGGYYYGAGGGGGGYRSSVSGEVSGQLSSQEVPVSATTGTMFEVTIGAGGASSVSQPATGSNGSSSIFHSITSVGGGGGGSTSSRNGLSGGSGGGGSQGGTPGSGTVNQGFSGFAGAGGTGTEASGGGGGAGAAATSKNGGAGISSSITGTAVGRAGGGGGYQNGTATDGGSAYNTAANPNTGGGGGGDYGGSGGSGIVILRYSSRYSIEASAGLTQTTSLVGNNKITQITAGTGTVTFS
jgi:hypothetical protein